MFSSQISSIEAQVKELLQRADQYRAVENQAEAVKDAIAQLQKSATTLNAEHEVMAHLFPEFQPTTRDDYQEEIHNLKRQLSLANDRADEAENLAAQYSKDCEALQQEKCDYVESAREWEKIAQQYQLPNNALDSFLVSGDSIFDTDTFDLQEIADNLAATPEWCIKARLRHTFSIAHQKIRESLTQHLPSELADFWRGLQMQNTNTAITVEVASEAISEEEAITADNGQLDIFTAIEEVEAINTNRYETAAEIEAALADEHEVDTHLMAIASILDSCPTGEVPGRIWFFVQNIPTEFDDRILGYLPMPLRIEWDKQRSFVEKQNQARESILPPKVEATIQSVVVLGAGDLVETPTGMIGHITDVTYNAKEGGRVATIALPDKSTVEFDIAKLSYIGKYQPPTPEFKAGDSVVTPTGETAVVLQMENIGGRYYLEVRSPNGAKETYYHTDVKPAPIETVGEIAAPVAAAAVKKIRKPKAKQVSASDILQCKTWEEIRAIAGNDPKLIKEAGAAAHTKIEKELIENLPELIRDYMYESRDFSDLDWLPNYIKQRVRCLMSEPGTSA